MRYKLRNISKMQWKNDGFRSLFESVIYPEVLEALKDWKVNNSSECVLIGGLALSYYVKPRPTQDIDLIFLSEKEIPTEVNKFKKNRAHSFEHLKTGVEVEVLSPEFLNADPKLFEEVFKTSILSDGIKVASPISLIALKLGRFNDMDKADISQLYSYCLENDMSTDLSIYNLNDELVNKFNKFTESLNENINNMYILESNFLFKNNNYKKVDTNLPYDLYIFEDKNGEPRFHIGINFGNRIKKYNDFQYSISLENTFREDGNLNVLESSTGYNSFNSFLEVGEELKGWLTDSKLTELKSIWSELNNE